MNNTIAFVAPSYDKQVTSAIYLSKDAIVGFYAGSVGTQIYLAGGNTVVVGNPVADVASVLGVTLFQSATSEPNQNTTSQVGTHL